MYGVMDEVFKFAATFKEFPPRSFPPRFNPANIMEDTLREIKAEREAAAGVPDAAGTGAAGRVRPTRAAGTSPGSAPIFHGCRRAPPGVDTHLPTAIHFE